MFILEFCCDFLDDDKYGHDFMGEAKYSLDRLRPDTTRELNLFLEKHYPVSILA